jgi:hypothetical protein
MTANGISLLQLLAPKLCLGVQMSWNFRFLPLPYSLAALQHSHP